MNLDADQSKGHFDELQMHLGLYDLLLVMVWQWETTDAGHYSPIIKDHFIGPAKAIATLKDELPYYVEAPFVDRDSCPERCTPAACLHHGEPLNAAGRRNKTDHRP